MEKSREGEWHDANKERKSAEARRRKEARQRLSEQRQEDAERRRARLLARKGGISWREEVAASAQRREKELERSDLPDEVREQIAKRKAAIEEAAQKRRERVGAAEAAKAQVTDGAEAAQELLAKRREAIHEAARKRGMFWKTEESDCSQEELADSDR